MQLASDFEFQRATQTRFTRPVFHPPSASTPAAQRSYQQFPRNRAQNQPSTFDQACINHRALRREAALITYNTQLRGICIGRASL